MVKKALRLLLSLARRPGLQRSLVALLVYTLVAFVALYPVPLRLNSVIAGFTARDGWEHTWWLWFARRLLLEGRGLGDLYLLNHPAGLQHPYQWSLVSFSLIALPLASLFSPAAAFNLMVLCSFALGGLAAYHLCRELTGSHWAALVGGAGRRGRRPSRGTNHQTSCCSRSSRSGLIRVSMVTGPAKPIRCNSRNTLSHGMIPSNGNRC